MFIKKYLSYMLFIFSMFVFINPKIIIFPIIIWDLIIFLYFIASLFTKYKFKKIEFLFYIVLTTLFISSLNSQIPSIGIIKSIAMMIFTFTLFRIFDYSPPNKNLILRTIEIMFILNFVMYFLPQGYYKNGLFMGIFNHSQSIGIFMIPLLVFYTINFLVNYRFFSLKDKGIHYIFITMGIICMLSSYSRTAIFTYVFLIILYVLKNKINIINFRISLLKTIIITFCIVVYIFNYERLNNMSYNYTYKIHGNNMFSSHSDYFFETRELLAIESLNNFKKSPILGNGFGIQYRDGVISDNEIKYLPHFYIPYTMVNEKGNVYFMVLEEGGLFSFIYFLFFIANYLRYVYNNQVILYSSLSIFIMFNGEATLFSINGAGAYQLLFLVLLYSMMHKRYNYL